MKLYQLITSLILVLGVADQGSSSSGLIHTINRHAPIVREFLVCPYTSGVKLDCESDGQIEVNFAFYGRAEETYLCFEVVNPMIPPPSICYVDGEEETLFNKCNDQNTCNIYVEPLENEPCFDNAPYVFIRHTCTHFVTPLIRASSQVSDPSLIFDRNLLTHFESKLEEKPWIVLSLNRSEIITRVDVITHDDIKQFIDPTKLVVQVTSQLEAEFPIDAPNSRTCFKDNWFGFTYNCFNNQKDDTVVIFSKVPGRLGIKEVVISTIPEFVDIGYEKNHQYNYNRSFKLNYPLL